METLGAASLRVLARLEQRAARKEKAEPEGSAVDEAKGEEASPGVRERNAWSARDPTPRSGLGGFTEAVSDQQEALVSEGRNEPWPMAHISRR